MGFQQADALRRLLVVCIAECNSLDKPIPLLVKLAPDLSDKELEEIALAVMECGVDGIVLCNTTLSRPFPREGRSGRIVGSSAQGYFHRMHS